MSNTVSVGLTGGIGSGKTTVAKRFEALGVPVIDTDIIARELVEPGQPAYHEILKIFTVSILDSSKRIDRAKLRKIIFSNPKHRMQLESILHPKIREEVARRVQKIQAPYCVVVVPLLIESGFIDMVDRVLVVDIAQDEQVRRAVARDGLGENEIKAIVRTQVDGQTRKNAADDIIGNNGSLDELYQKVDDLHRKYLEMFKTTPIQRKVTQDTTTVAPTPTADVAPVPNLATPTIAPKLELTHIPEPFAGGYVFEQPLNERIRTLMRLETLFLETDFHLQGDSIWSTRAAMKGFINIMLVLGRPELKTELMKEIDRIHTALTRFSSVQGVDAGRLGDISQELFGLLRYLRSIEGQIGYSLKVNEFLAVMRQRESAPGGAMSCDVPLFEYWLGKEPDVRRADIVNWLKEYETLRRAIMLILKLVRASAAPRAEIARNGHYQANLDSGVPYQMIRLFLPRDTDCFPEVSAGRHRFTIRFVRPMGFDRPVQSEGELPFLIACCAL